MEKKIKSKIRFFLYNYNNTNKLIKEKENQIIDSVNISGNQWIRGRYCDTCSNSLENQVIRLIENKDILNIKRWHSLNSRVFIFLFKQHPIYYKFVKLKYIEKRTKEEIKNAMKMDFKEQKTIDGQVLRLIHKNAKLRNLN